LRMHVAEASAGLKCPQGDPRRRPSSSSRAVAADETCALLDLLLKYPDETLATYV
jgi:hypothetical protein